MEEFTRNRITELRITKGVSEYQMSYDLGHSRSYINNISSHKSLPSLPEFFSICNYLGITPAEFFDTKINNPVLLEQAITELKQLSSEDLTMIINLAKRLNDKSKK